MIFIYGFFGFLIGFGLGLGTANVLLRNKPKEELKNNKSLIWTYGLGVWIMGGIGGVVGVWIFNNNIF